MLCSGTKAYGAEMAELPVILVIEDEVLLQGVVRDALKEAGFDLLMTSSAEEALTVLKSGTSKCSALVTDVNLGDGMNGWEVAREVRQIDPAFPVIYMTGAAAIDWPAQGVPGSILLEKPFAPAQLVTAISQLLNVSTPPTTTLRE